MTTVRLARALLHLLARAGMWQPPSATVRKLTRTLATLAITASAVSGVLGGATEAAYATHLDAGRALLHGHRAAGHSALSDPAAAPGTPPLV
jgi:hypothetical protein